VNATEKSAAASDAFGSETDSFIGPARSGVLRKDAEPNAVGIGISKYDMNEIGQERSAMPKIWTRNGNPLYERDLFAGSPITHNGEAD